MDKTERILAIDDVREHGYAHILARTYRDGEAALKLLGPWDALYLDHDLCGLEHQFTDTGKELTGYDICLFLEQNPQFRPEQIFVITGSSVGRERIQRCLERLYKGVRGGGCIFFDPIKE